MRAFIRKDKFGHFTNVNPAIAAHGLLKMGWELIDYTDFRTIKGLQHDDLVVGHIADTRYCLEQLGISYPKGLDYPVALQSFLGRKVWADSLHKVLAEKRFPVFLKPRRQNKLFTGVLIREERDLIAIGYRPEDIEVWCSEPVHFVKEERCFIRYGRILDVRHYKGDWRRALDAQVMEAAVSAFKDAPNGFALDFGLTSEGKTLLIEGNDGYSLGAYGLLPLDYAKLLSARWFQLTKAVDPCNF